MLGCGGPAFGELDDPPLPPGSSGIWPNLESRANSDPWIAQNHERLRVLRPKVLALNFFDSHPKPIMELHVRSVMDALREGSRYHGYGDPAAAPMLDYELYKSIDLRDDPVPSGSTIINSSRYPRESSPVGWGIDYGRLFSQEFAKYYAIADPADGHAMDLCELVNAGIIQELWLYAVDTGDKSDVSYAEVLEIKPRYDENRQRVPGPLDGCAGNGCFDATDLAQMPAHCTRSLRILWINATRGPGCVLENFDHGFEHTAAIDMIPYLSRHFRKFADFDLDQRYGTPFSNWYTCDYANATGCLTYGERSVDYDTPAARGTIADYVPVCGMAHIPPNGRGHYDYWGSNTVTVVSTCEHFQLGDGPGGRDREERFDSSKYVRYNDLAPDCGGGWHVWWRQNFPGLDNAAKDSNGAPMLPWWPFLFY
jgi:hypothetical protein